MSVPFKNRLQRYYKESLDTLFRTLEFKRGVERYSSGSTFLTTTVTITAAELLTTAPGDTLKELIPAPGVGKYIAINRFVGKFKNATVAYDNSPSVEFATNIASYGAFDISTLGTTENFVIYKGNGLASGINGNIYAKYKSSTVTPTVGDGEVIVEIEYEILDF